MSNIKLFTALKLVMTYIVNLKINILLGEML